MIFRQTGRAQNGQAQSAGEMSRVDHSNIFKGLCRLKGVLITQADVFSHGDMDDILRLGQLLRKKAFIVLHFGRLGEAFVSLDDMGQQFVRL